MPLYIAPDGTKSILKDTRVVAAELQQADGTTLAMVNVRQGEHNVVLLLDEVQTFVAALQSMANEVRKANKARKP